MSSSPDHEVIWQFPDLRHLEPFKRILQSGGSGFHSKHFQSSSNTTGHQQLTLIKQTRGLNRNPKFLGKLNFIFICLICINCEMITTIGSANTHHLRYNKKKRRNTFLHMKRTQDLLS